MAMASLSVSRLVSYDGRHPANPLPGFRGFYQIKLLIAMEIMNPEWVFDRKQRIDQTKRFSLGSYL